MRQLFSWLVNFSVIGLKQFTKRNIGWKINTRRVQFWQASFSHSLRDLSDF